jgi:hypothetical protein
MVRTLLRAFRKPIPTRSQLNDVLAASKDVLLNCGTEEAEKTIRAALRKYRLPGRPSIRFVPGRNCYHVSLIANGFSGEARIDVPKSVGGL